MGVMHFLIGPGEQLDGGLEVERAYVSGPERRVYPTRTEIEGNVLSCRRSVSESGRLNVHFPVPGFGRPVVSTSSLLERDEPYLLALELARGKIAQVRDQVGAWEIAGMAVPEEFPELDRTAYQLFTKAASIQHVTDQASALAVEALAKAHHAAEVLARAYTKQRLGVRRRRSGAPPASLGCSLGRAILRDDAERRFCEAFTAAMVPIEWRSIEPVEGQYQWDQSDAQVAWCEHNRLLTYGGPLLDLSANGMPAWLSKWDKDFFNLLSFVSDFVETAISRYVGRIRNWDVVAHGNSGGALCLNEENRLSLVARALEVARHIDEDIQLQVRVDQPWGDYQARGEHRLSPLQFVDALLRSGVGLSAVNLEIGVGYRTAGCPNRDLLEFSRLIDHWSCLGVPLSVILAFPSGDGADEFARPNRTVDACQWKSPWTWDAQAEWVELYVPLLMAKQSIVGVFWAHFDDGSEHDFPHAGLLAADGREKPALTRFAKYRRAYWTADNGED